MPVSIDNVYNTYKNLLRYAYRISLAHRFFTCLTCKVTKSHFSRSPPRPISAKQSPTAEFICIPAAGLHTSKGRLTYNRVSGTHRQLYVRRFIRLCNRLCIRLCISPRTRAKTCACLNRVRPKPYKHIRQSVYDFCRRISYCQKRCSKWQPV